MKKAWFIRKCTNAEEYFDLLNNKPYFANQMKYKVVHVIKANDSSYKKFVSNFLEDDIIIKKITNKLIIDETGCVHVALITQDYNSGFLIYPSGYSYARYVAFWSKDKDGDYNV